MAFSRADVRQLLDKYNKLLRLELTEQEQMDLFTLQSIDELRDIASNNAIEFTHAEIIQLKRILNEFNNPVIHNTLNKVPAILKLITKLLNPPALPRRNFKIPWGTILGATIGLGVGAICLFFPPATIAIATFLALSPIASASVIIASGLAIGIGVDVVRHILQKRNSIKTILTTDTTSPIPCQNIYTLLEEKESSPLQNLKNQFRARCEIPGILECPFNLDYPVDPILLNGRLYERKDIQLYCDKNKFDPFRKSIDPADLSLSYNKNNEKLKKLMSEFKEYRNDVLKQIDNLTDENVPQIEQLVAEYVAKSKIITEDFLTKLVTDQKSGYQPGLFKSVTIRIEPTEVLPPQPAAPISPSYVI